MNTRAWLKGAILLGWLCTLALPFAQQPSGTRVGVTRAVQRIPLHERPCIPSWRVGPIAGTDGLLLDSPTVCGGERWVWVSWSTGQRAWSPETLGAIALILPMPGRGNYPNISAPLAYPVHVTADGNPLNVRSGPGLNYAILTQKPAGATGWAYQVSVDTANRLVWWRIRWDDANGGQVGWSADSRLTQGVFLTLTGAPRPVSLLSLSANVEGVAVSVSLRDLNGIPSSGSTPLPASLSYVEGTALTLSAPSTAPNGFAFAYWELNGTPYATTPTITLNMQGTMALRAVYQSSEAVFLANLVAPWRANQYWTPSTYDGHGGGNILNAVDFNRASSPRTTCPYTSGWIQDCDEVILASHAGRAYTRAQSGCTGYGNYSVVVSDVRVGSSGTTYLATIYAHLNWFLVANGTVVSAGQPIARLGSTGSSTGPHLHYEIREVTVSGSTLTLGTRRQVLNNPAIRLSGQPLEVDLNCTVSGLGYAGRPILGSASVGSVPTNIAGTCTPYSCGGFLRQEEVSLPDRCLPWEEEPIVLLLTDIDGNSRVDDEDLLRVLHEMGTTEPSPADVNWDGRVDETDLLMVLMDFGREE